MKTLCAFFPGRSTATPKTSFGETLKQLTPGLQKKPGVAAQPPSHLKPTLPGVAAKIPQAAAEAKATQQVISTHQKTAATLTSARTSAHHGAAQLKEARVAHQSQSNERLDGRLVDLICKELAVEFTADAAKTKPANQDIPAALAPTSTSQPATQPHKQSDAQLKLDGSVRAAQAVELIEKIETFIKDSRTPSIALTLNNSLGAKVEIERVGPREVALKVIGHRGPPRAEDIGRIRDEMAAHGLKVSALSVA